MRFIGLHLGCGKNYFPGWLNLDLDSPLADLHHDLRNPLPFPDGVFRLVHSEHLIEHLTLAEGVALFRECYRTLENGGVMRVAMPDLDYLVERYQNDWRDQDWLHWPGFEFIQTRAQMMNIGMREWGHKYLYNREELELRLLEAGFSDVRFVKHGTSNIVEFMNLETRVDSILVAEAVR